MLPMVLLAQNGGQAAPATQSAPVATPVAGPAPGAAKSPAAAEAKMAAVKAQMTAAAEGTEGSLSIPLKITLTPSESPIKLGLASNIAAVIQNVSSKPVQINLSSLQLTTHSIVAAHGSRCVTPLPASTNTTGATKSDDGYSVILQPSDQVTALFSLSETHEAAQPLDSKLAGQLRDSCEMNLWDKGSRFLDFSPGNYEYFMSGYFTSNNAAGVPIVRTFSSNATFPVGIDQTTVILFSVVGGWLALFVVTFMNAGNEKSVIARMSKVQVPGTGLRGFLEKLSSSESIKALVHFGIQMLGAAILSASVTIVSSRMSESQLPVKISILDAWGAMTVGFVAYFIGKKFINSLASWGGETPAAPNKK